MSTDSPDELTTDQQTPAAPPHDQRLASAEAANGDGANWLMTGLKLFALAVVAALLGLLGWATLAASGRGTLVTAIAAGDKPPAPAFELGVLWAHVDTWPPRARTALVDDRLALAELRGRPVVINFWASWCIPCRKEAPLLNAAARRHRGQVVFLGVDVQDLESDALAFLREFAVPYVSVRDRGNKTFDAYGLTGVPETYYLAADGRIVAHAPGPVTDATLEAGIRATVSGRVRQEPAG